MSLEHVSWTSEAEPANTDKPQLYLVLFYRLVLWEMCLKDLFADLVWKQRLKLRPLALLTKVHESFHSNAKNKKYFC